MTSGQTAAWREPAVVKLHSVKEWSVQETRSWLLVQGKGNAESKEPAALHALVRATLTLQSGHSEYCKCVDSDKATWGKCSADH